MKIKSWIGRVIKERNDKNTYIINQYNTLFKEVSDILINENVQIAIRSDSELKENTLKLYIILKDIFNENN